MHLLILEYVTAGGLGTAAQQSLCAEADAMALALARDFGLLPGVQVTLLRCPSLPWPDSLPASVRRSGTLHMGELPGLIRAHDAVLLVAPESGHILHALSAQVESLGRPLLGPSAAAVACAGDKWLTSLALAAAGVAQLPTMPLSLPWLNLPGPWVLKPADGCGCEGLRRYPDQTAARTAAASLSGSSNLWLAQPWMPGIAASLTVLGSASGTQLLSVNIQRLAFPDDGSVSLTGVETGALEDRDGRLARLAAEVHAAIPGLNGIWGIDIVIGENDLRVIEVNPRVTSAYCALARHLGANPAARWLAVAPTTLTAHADVVSASAAVSPANPAAVPAARRHRRQATVLGWDLGGAHLKVAALDQRGLLIDVVQLPCALWQGLDRLEPLLADLCQRWGAPQRHALTMSGEMVDLFPDRAHGVSVLIDCFVRHAGAVPVQVYAGPEGWRSPAQSAANPAAIASANWLAMGDWAAGQLEAGVVLDLGSTTLDALCFHGGRARPAAVGDAGRLASGELVYTGIARTPLMALAHQVNLGGRAVGLMAEWFASTADVYRVLGELPDDTDLHPSADGGPKSVEGSLRRLARMVGCDGPEWPLATWKDVARQFRTVQLERIDEALALALERLPTRAGMPTVVVAGAGAFLASLACARHPVKVLPFELLGGLVDPGRSDLGEQAGRCAPAVAVAALAMRSV